MTGTNSAKYKWKIKTFLHLCNANNDQLWLNNNC